MDTRPAQPPVELPPDKLRWRCDPASIPFPTTTEAEPAESESMQERALRALRTGVELNAPGFNMFVCGLAGASRGDTIARLICEMKPAPRPSFDRCFVNNFKNPDQPLLLTLARGSANSFKKEVAAAIDFLRRRIPQLFESETFERRKGRIVERYSLRERELMDEFTRRMGREQFALVRVNVGPAAMPEIAPLIDGQAVPMEEVPRLVEAGKLTATAAQDLGKRYEEFRQEFSSVYRKTLSLSRELSGELNYLEQEAASAIVDGVLQELKDHYPGKDVAEYIEEVRLHILNNLESFKQGEGEEERPDDGGPEHPPRGERDPFRVYGVNVILAHDGEPGCPVIFETVPTYANLFGTVQRSFEGFASWRSDYMDLRAGSLLQADGGFLILYALDALGERGVWPTLKRTLNHRRLEIQPVDAFYPFGTPALKPEPISVDVKVVLVGDQRLYELLYEFEEEFRKIFKVRVEFDEVVDWSDALVKHYGGRVHKIADEEGLLPLDRTAVAAVLEFGVRRAGRRGKLTARFSELADVAREASYLARQAGERVVIASHVHRALEAKIERHNLTETKIREMIEQGMLLIDTTGRRVGQVNGLSVLEVGGYAFGKPVRITASVALGKTGLINIEREANLSGRLHDKGVQIIAGYLRQVFAQDKPLSLSASLCFEQSYAGVDGDSASSTEIYALLSALSDLPINQEVAVTGSVNQQGDIQPIGGVNEKIEGFFDVCRARGELTGAQGVIIPRENIEDLMLRGDLIEAVSEGRFHIYPVESVEQGIAALTGVDAGQRDSSGKFPPGTVYALADQRLAQMAEILHQYE
ncbi:MAG TPA: AAA family ATPase [Candidatus Acidoferrales bacterium]|nr:AAA family ATPase [Candidatus Acidoferrales bacterium]